MTSGVYARPGEEQGPRSVNFGVVLACFVTLNALYMPFPWWVNLAVPLVYWAFARYVQRRRLDEFRGGWWAVSELAIGLAWGCLVHVAATAPMGPIRMDFAYVATASALAVVLWAACEELIWRGLLLAQLEVRLGSLLALVIAAAVFSLVHLSLTPIDLIIFFLDGIVFGAAFILTRRLWLPIGIHAALNLTVPMIAGPQMNYALFIGLQVAAAVMLLVIAKKRGRVLKRESASWGHRDTAVAADEAT